MERQQWRPRHRAVHVAREQVAQQQDEREHRGEAEDDRMSRTHAPHAHCTPDAAPLFPRSDQPSPKRGFGLPSMKHIARSLTLAVTANRPRPALTPAPNGLARQPTALDARVACARSTPMKGTTRPDWVRSQRLPSWPLRSRSVAPPQTQQNGHLEPMTELSPARGGATRLRRRGQEGRDRVRGQSGRVVPFNGAWRSHRTRIWRAVGCRASPFGPGRPLLAVEIHHQQNLSTVRSVSHQRL